MNISSKYQKQKNVGSSYQIEKSRVKETQDKNSNYIDVEARQISSHEWQENKLPSEFFSNAPKAKRQISIPSSLIPVILATVGLAGVGTWGITHWSDFKFTNPALTGKNASSNKSASEGDFKVAPKNAPSGEFPYGGSAAWAPIRKDIDPILQKSLPEFELQYTPADRRVLGSDEGIQMLLDNQIAFAQSSRPLHAQEYQQALQKGYSLSETAVAFEGVAVATHLDLDIPSLTLAQLKQIYTGKIANWSEVGGPDLEIVPYSLSLKDSGTAEFFDYHVMGGLPLGNNTIVVPTTTEALHKVAQHPGSIFYGSAPEIVGQCTVKPIPIGTSPDRAIAPYQGPLVSDRDCPARRNHLNLEAMEAGKYPLIQPLFVVVKHNNDIEERAGETYADWMLSNKGQNLLEKAGYIPLAKYQ